MKLIAAILGALLVLFPTAARSDPVFEIERNTTFETAMILLLLSPSSNAPTVGIRPMAEEARAYFADYADHPSVQIMDQFVREDREHGDHWLQLVSGVMIVSAASERAPPRASYDPERIGIPSFDFDRAERWRALMAAVNRFYREAPVRQFLERTEAQYQCGAEEVRRNLPSAELLPAMERYYGASVHRYVLTPAPMSFPSVNFGVLVNTPRGPEARMVMGPLRVTRDPAAFGCGFDDRETLSWLTVHEFGHAFVNPLIETPEMHARIDRDAHLFAPIQDEQGEQGMGDWFGAVTEHLVRLGEIEVLESIGDTEGAQRRRLDNVLERKFIYLPLLEARMEEYNADRQRYPTFQSFLERLLDAFDDREADSGN